MATPLDSISGKIVVKPERIESELARVRSAVGATPQSEERIAEPNAQVRVTLSNLILLSIRNGDPTREQKIDHIINDLCMRHPSRFIAVTYDLTQRGAEILETAVSSRCGIARSGAHVCSEEVYVTSTGDTVRVVANLVRSLLRPDTQTVLLVLGDPRDEALMNGGTTEMSYQLQYKYLLSSLQNLSDRVIYDSAEFSSFSDSVRAVFDYRRRAKVGDTTSAEPHEHSRVYQVRDTTWRRIIRWRRVLSEQFDVEGGEDAAQRIECCSIECNCSADKLTAQNLPAEALLLVGWFAARLDWKLISSAKEKIDGGFTVRFRTPKDQTIRVDFLSTKTKIEAPEALCSVSLRLKVRDEEVVIRAVLGSDGRTVEMRKQILGRNESTINANDIFSRRLPFVKKSFEDLVHDDIVSIHFDGSADGALSEALRIADIR